MDTTRIEKLKALMKVLKESGKIEDELKPLMSEICLKVFKDGGARDNNGTGDPEQQWELKLKRLTSKIEDELRKAEISTSTMIGHKDRFPDQQKLSCMKRGQTGQPTQAATRQGQPAQTRSHATHSEGSMTTLGTTVHFPDRSV